MHSSNPHHQFPTHQGFILSSPVAHHPSFGSHHWLSATSSAIASRVVSTSSCSAVRVLCNRLSSQYGQPLLFPHPPATCLERLDLRYFTHPSTTETQPAYETAPLTGMCSPSAHTCTRIRKRIYRRSTCASRCSGIGGGSWTCRSARNRHHRRRRTS